MSYPASWRTDPEKLALVLRHGDVTDQSLARLEFRSLTARAADRAGICLAAATAPTTMAQRRQRLEELRRELDMPAAPVAALDETPPRKFWFFGGIR